SRRFRVSRKPRRSLWNTAPWNTCRPSGPRRSPSSRSMRSARCSAKSAAPKLSPPCTTSCWLPASSTNSPSTGPRTCQCAARFLTSGRGGMLDRIRRHWILYVLIAPILAYFCAFLFYPMAQGVYLSTQKAGLLGPVGFIGLDNYIKVFATPAVWEAIWNTLILAAGITIVGVILPILPAIALVQVVPDWLKRGLQTIIYTPYL